MSLSLLLDNADPGIWSDLLQLGIFNGVTTNPTLLRDAGQPCNIQNLQLLAKEAKKLGCKELHIQAWGNNPKEIWECGREIGKLTTCEMPIHVKVPITKVGVKAAKELINTNISVTFTACYHVKQVLIASTIGATYVAPYLGRIYDQGNDGLAELLSMQKVLKETSSKCKILVASIRDIDQIIHLASNGVSTFTINVEIAKDLFKSLETIKAAKCFEIDATRN